MSVIKRCLAGLVLVTFGGLQPAWSAGEEEAFALRPHVAGLPSMPPQARRDDVSGYVTVAALLDSDGYPVTAEVVDANPAGYFEEAATKRFTKRWRFVLPPSLPRCSLVEARVTFHFDHETTGFPVAMDPPQGRYVGHYADADTESLTELPTLDVYRDPLGRIRMGWAATGDWPEPPYATPANELRRGIAVVLLDIDARGRVSDVNPSVYSGESARRFILKHFMDWQAPLPPGPACLTVDFRDKQP